MSNSRTNWAVACFVVLAFFSAPQSHAVQRAATLVPARLSLEGMRIVVDCANGAGYRVGPSVFAELGADVVAIGCKPDGTNINKGCNRSC